MPFQGSLFDGRDIEKASIDYISNRSVQETYAGLGLCTDNVVVEEGQDFLPQIRS